jgi:hypothetical protein
MSRFIATLAIVVVGLVVLTAATPALTKLAHALVPLIVAVGIVVALLKLVFWYTR